jgi:predicted RNA methylase
VSKGIHIQQQDAALAQHFTPEGVANFVWRMVRRRSSRLLGTKPRIIDPAAGSGAWLKAVVESGYVQSEDVYGIEVDARLERPERGVSYTGDGLLGRFPGVEDGSFDAVVGNPPFGKLSQFLDIMGNPPYEVLQNNFEICEHVGGSLASFPIELLFLERALQLVRPQGWVAFVMPEGFFANARQQVVRDWIGLRYQVLDIVELPEVVFRAKGLNARTGIVLLRKKRPRGRVQFFAPAVPCRRADVDTYLQQVQKGGGPQVLGLSLTQGQMTGKRWDPGYWQGAVRMRQLGSRFVLKRLGDYIEHLTYGPIITGRKPEHVEDGIVVIRQGDIAETGVSRGGLLKVTVRGDFDPERSRVQRGDLLMPRSGAGALGRNRMAVYTERAQANVGCFVDRIRLRGINPFYVWFFFKTKVGWEQIEALINGVGTPNINFDEIRSLRVPEIDVEVQAMIEARYRRDVLPWHRRRHSSEKARARGEQSFRQVVAELQSYLMGESETGDLLVAAGAPN